MPRGIPKGKVREPRKEGEPRKKRTTIPPVPPKGSRYAFGKGRPPTVFSDDEVIAFGEDLLKWMEKMDREEKPVWHLSDWYYDTMNFTPSEWDTLENRVNFIPYKKRAMQWMGKKVLSGPMATAYGSRFVGIYFGEVREHEKQIMQEKIDYELESKEKIERRKGSPPNDDALTELIKEVKELSKKVE